MDTTPLVSLRLPAPPSGSPCSNQLRPDGLASWTAIAWALLTKQPLAEFVGLFGCGRIKVGAFKWSCGPREWEVTGPAKRAGAYAPIGAYGAIFPMGNACPLLGLVHEGR